MPASVPRRVLALAIAIFGIAVLIPTLSAAHPERATKFPDLHEGKVPKVSHSGKALYVCHHSRKRVHRIFSGGQEQARLDQVRHCDFHHIQAAIDAAKSGYRIRILPGIYKEKPSRKVKVGSFGKPPCANDYVETEGIGNDAPPPAGPTSNDPAVRPDRNYQVDCPNSKNLIEVVGDPRPEPNPVDPILPKCLQLCDLQIEGLGEKPGDVRIVSDRLKMDALRIDRADGIVIRNLSVEQGAFNGIDIVETNGFRIEDVVVRYNQHYGALSFTSTHGLYNRVKAYGNGDSGVYPGSNQKGCDPVGDYPIQGDGTCGSDPSSRADCGEPTTEIKNSNSFHNTLGYSGTAGNSTYLHNNKFHGNASGIATDSFASGHPGMPQECVLWENNDIYSNNFNPFASDTQQYCTDHPFEDRRKKVVCPQFTSPVGTGIIMGGANRDLVTHNRIYDNWRYGVFLLTVPASIRGDTDPNHQQDTSNGNRFIDNTMGVGPGGVPDLNGTDFEWDGGGQGNCWQGNTGPGGDPVTSGPAPVPTCPGSPVWMSPNPAVTGAAAPCTAWDPKTQHMPPGCDWFVVPPEP